jgi:hypothetical protein
MLERLHHAPVVLAELCSKPFQQSFVRGLFEIGKNSKVTPSQNTWSA